MEFSERLKSGILKPVEHAILDAASMKMVERGFASCRISEIAQFAGVTEPTIYQYFNGKEDLLFRVVERKAEEALAFQEEQLQGIAGAYNKLRKLVWAHLHYNDKNREYISLVLMECRSNMAFYKSRGYRLFRRYSGSYLSLLEEGVREGTFRGDIDVHLLRDLILGLLDFEAYTVLVTGEIAEAAPDHPHIMMLLEHILLRSERRRKPPQKKREEIIETAVKQFARKGYVKTTISEIAKAAGISDGALYDHFKNKEDLLISIPQQRFQRHTQDLEEMFHDRSIRKKLQAFILNHFWLYLEDNDFLIVYLTLIQLNRRFYRSHSFHRLQEYINLFEGIVREGIQTGVFNSACNIRVFRNMFWGAFTHMSLRWFILEEDKNADKFREIGHITDYLLDALTGQRHSSDTTNPAPAALMPLGSL